MKTTNTFRMFAVGGVALAAAFGGCQAQPPQPCQIAQASTALTFLSQFWANYELQTGTGSCSTLTGDEIGFQTYVNPKNDQELRFAIRAYGLGAKFAGETDPVPRVDPTDPEGKKINSVANMTPFPDTSYVCKNEGAVPEAVQNFQAETYEADLADGGTEMRTLPAETIKYQWSDIKWLSSPGVPGQAFTATLQYTVDTCTATYKATGIWPATHCVTDADCSPNPLPDAVVCTDDPPTTCPANQITDPSRQVLGSGLNPAFNVKCGPDSICILSDSFDTLVESQ